MTVTASCRGLLFGVLVVVGLAIVCSQEAQAQVPTVKAKGTLIAPLEFIAYELSYMTTTKLFVVPDKMRAVITDVIITSEGPACHGQRIYRDGMPVTAFITVPASSTFSHTFATGINYAAGETIAIRNGGNDGATYWTLRGYLTK